jgi:hypothetical protein
MLEEAGKVASNAVEGLKNQPLLLALVLLQAFVLAAVLYNSLSRQTSNDKQFAQIFELLKTCVGGT